MIRFKYDPILGLKFWIFKNPINQNKSKKRKLTRKEY